MRRSLAALLVASLLPACSSDPDPVPWEVSDTQLRFDLSLTEGFWSFPWPSDLRLTTEGRPDTTGFPNPSDVPLLTSYIEYPTQVMDGFGRSAPIYFAFDGPLELPSWDVAAAEASGRCEGPVRILDVDPDSPDHGLCVPAQWRWVEDSTDPWIDSYTLTVAPYWGFPLRNATTYAVYVVDATDPEGRHLQAPPLLRDALAGEGELAATYEPLADCWQDEGTEDAPSPACEGAWGAAGPDWLAAATVFTTQDATAELERMARYVAEGPDGPLWTGELRRIESGEPHFQNDLEYWDGAYMAPNFQRGEVPYASDGGGFVFDDDGDPIPQLDERIPFVIALPDAAFTMPAAGWPVVLQSHGTTGDRFSHFGSSQMAPARLMARRGFVSVGIPQPFHGDRWPEGTDVALELNSFNYFNPESGRSVLRQGALDAVAQLRFVREMLAQGGEIAELHPELRIDPERVYFMGHSQGGITGALALPYLDGLGAAVLSGAGGGMAMTLVQRTDPPVLDLLSDMMQAPSGTRFTDLHPVMGLVQMLVEVTDPLYYAPQWYAEAQPGQARSVLLTEGLHDEQTPADTSEALAVAGRLTLCADFQERDVAGLELRGLEPRELPFGGNAMAPDGTAVTAGLAQFDSNHFAVFNIAEAANLWADFLYSHATDGPPGQLGAGL